MGRGCHAALGMLFRHRMLHLEDHTVAFQYDVAELQLKRRPGRQQSWLLVRKRRFFLSFMEFADAREFSEEFQRAKPRVACGVHDFCVMTSGTIFTSPWFDSCCSMRQASVAFVVLHTSARDARVGVRLRIALRSPWFGARGFFAVCDAIRASAPWCADKSLWARLALWLE